MARKAVEKELLAMEEKYWQALKDRDGVTRNGRWLCASHTESLKGDPFGRDRMAAIS